MPVLSRPFFVALTGVLGVGKTTAAQLLSQRLEMQFIDEGAQDNPFLGLAYHDGPRWALCSQLWFMAERMKKGRVARHILQRGSVVQDVIIQQDCAVYIEARKSLGHLTDQEYALYQRLYGSVASTLPNPDLLINLRASIPVIADRIHRRDRLAEAQIDTGYLALLDDRQRAWINSVTLPIWIVDTDQLDLVQNESDKALFVRTVQDQLELLKR